MKVSRRPYRKAHDIEFLDIGQEIKDRGLRSEALIHMFGVTPESLATISNYIKNAESSRDDEYYSETLNLEVKVQKANGYKYSSVTNKIECKIDEEIIKVTVKIYAYLMIQI